MRPVLFTAFLVASSLCMPFAPIPRAQVLDSIVAVVNGDAVTESELALELERMEQSIVSAGTIALPSRGELRPRVLDLVINRRLQLQRGRELGIDISDGELERTIRLFRSENRLEDDSAFGRFLNDMGTSPERFREEFRDDLIIGETVRRDVVPYMNITEEEVERQVRKQKEGNFINQYQLNQIFIEVASQLSDSEKDRRRELAESLLGKLAAGESFESLAALHSDAESSRDGGNLGWRDASMLPDNFLDALRRTEVGEVTPVIEAANGYHLLYLADTREMPVGRGDVSVRLNIITLDPAKADASALAEDLRGRLLAGEPFGELARAHSADQATGQQGGDTGWINLDDLLPALARVAASMEVGEISAPIDSGIGIHIIELADIVVQGIDEDELHRKALRDLQERRLFEARSNWIGLLRANAHIKVREAG